MGPLEFFLDAKKTIIFFAAIGIYAVFLDIKSLFYFFDVIVIGAAFWFGLNIACVNVGE